MMLYYLYKLHVSKNLLYSTSVDKGNLSLFITSYHACH